MNSLIPENFETFLAEDDGEPVVMLNLLRFKANGRDSYQRYLAMAGPIVARFGAEITFVGDGLTALCAEQGQSWDAVALVRYPSRRAFADMIADPEYAKVNPVRMAALEEGVLQPLKQMPHG